MPQTATAEKLYDPEFRLAQANMTRTARRSKLPNDVTQPAWAEEQVERLRLPPIRYRPELAQNVIEWMAKGYSLGGVAGRIGVARSTITDWQERFPEFGASVARAKAVQQFYWETRFINDVEAGRPVQGTIFALINCGREDWRNKQEVELSGQVTFTSIVERAMKTIEAQRLGQNSAAEQPAIETDFTYSEQQVSDGFDDTF